MSGAWKAQPVVGELRPSQMIYTYGVGATVDLPHFSAIVQGLDRWWPDQGRILQEDRLLEVVQRKLGPHVSRLVTPPQLADDEGPALPGAPPVGVCVAPFPRWFRCPVCQQLLPLGSPGLKRARSHRADQIHYEHALCTESKSRRPPTVYPARFLVACEHGHLDDFPWEWYVHSGGSCGAPVLKLFERGVQGDASSVVVACACGARKAMSKAFSEVSDLPACRGFHPHLGTFSSEPCPAALRGMTLGASNLWFGVSVSALHIPASAQTALQRRIQAHSELFDAVEQTADLSYMRRRGELAAFADVSDADLFDALKSLRQASQATARDRADVRTPEWEVLTEAAARPDSDDFLAVDTGIPSGWGRVIEQVVQVKRLREVMALVGFTRIQSPRDFADEEPVKNMAPLSRKKLDFVPASEVRGEGLFLKFREELLAAWVDAHRDLEQAFLDSHVGWRKARRSPDPEAHFPGLRYVAIHSFAHALMRQMALECGYSAASLRERLYVREPGGEGPPMGGVLIYTSAPDSEGTLGGLVRLGEPAELGRHLEAARRSMERCSSDPICAEHEPVANGLELHGAACHACLFAPETSCERGNRYLDRTALVQTIRQAGTGWLG
jgi:hypothetical protein